jgi:hypothetical protein
VNAGIGLDGGGTSGDVTLKLDTLYTDDRYVNEDQDTSVTTDMLKKNAVTVDKVLPNIVSSVNGVTNDGGNIDIEGGDNITITPDDVNNRIMIAISGGRGGDEGDITAVIAGEVLDGGGESGDVTLHVEVSLHLSSSTSEVIKGTHITSSNYGYLGGGLYGVYGKHSSSGDYGYLGSSDYGLCGYSNSGRGVYGFSSNSTYGYLGSNSFSMYGENGNSGN